MKLYRDPSIAEARLVSSMTDWKYLKPVGGFSKISHMPSRGWPKQKPNLTRADGEAILRAAKNQRDRLILRLTMEAGLKTGQIVGSHDKRKGTKVPAIRIRDLAEDFIVVFTHGIRREQPVNPELIDQLRKFHNPGAGEHIFNFSDASVRKMVGVAVRNAKIKNAALVTPDSLRFLLRPEVPRFQLHLREHFSEDVVNAEMMAQYYIAAYCLENNIRRLIRDALSKHTDWWKNKVPPKIQEYVEERQNEERETPRSMRSSDPLDYTTLGHLSNIIEVNWPDFADQIRSQEVMKQILGELNELRAIVAHSGILDQRERDRFDLCVRDWQVALK